jgi:hypothetical protein
MGDPGTVVLLGYYLVKLGLQVSPHRRDGVLPVEERDGFLKVAAVAGQLVRG